MTRKYEQTLASVTGEGTGTLNSDLSPGNVTNFTAFLDVTAASGTPTLDVKFQEWDEASDKWFDIPSAAFAQKTGVANERITFSSNAKLLRAVRTVGGTTPSFDYTLGIVGAA